MINKFGVLFQLSKELNIIKILEREKERFLNQIKFSFLRAYKKTGIL